MNSREKAIKFWENVIRPATPHALAMNIGVKDLAKLLDSHAAEARAEQREACADIADQICRQASGGRHVLIASEVKEACLSATGEE